MIVRVGDHCVMLVCKAIDGEVSVEVFLLRSCRLLIGARILSRVGIAEN